MSDMRKLLKIMESVPPVIATAPQSKSFERDATVVISPRVGGGVGRFMEYTAEDTALIDIKGVAKEFGKDDFSMPERDLQNGNDWFHMSVKDDTMGTSNDKPEFRPGDMVKVADVYGTVIGPGFGTFIGYGTTGEDCVILFDGKQIIVPVENVASVLEQDAKDNFDEMDNDGNLSPMSFGSDNVKIEQPQTGMSREPAMDHRDEFSKWMAAVEEAMEVTDPVIMDNAAPANQCGCGSWDCPVCFPDDQMGGMGQPQGAVVIGGQDMGAMDAGPEACPTCGHQHDDQEMHGELELVGDTGSFSLKDDMEDPDMVGMNVEEEENTFVEKPRSGKGVKLGNIVQSTKVVPTGGDNSPMTMGGDNLGEGPDDVDFDGPEELEMGSPLSRQDYHNEMEPIDPDEAMGLISTIMDFQQSGLSNASTPYDEAQLSAMNANQLRKIHSQVTGSVGEASKPTKTKTDTIDLDFGDDILGNQNPVANIDEPVGFDDEPTGPSGMDSLNRSSSANTRSKTAGITPSDTMRDLMNRISPDAGAGEPDRPEMPTDAVAIRTATDVPAVLDSALRAAGVENPEWHSVNDLPGMGNRNIRGVGRNVFSAFTSTPQEQILTLANVNGQGPSTDAEMRAVGGWLKNYAEDMGPVTVDFGTAIPGYKPDVREFRANGIRFHVVRDPAGQYIYAYPDQDARSHGAAQGQLPGQGGGMPPQGQQPRLREMQPTLFEQIKFDNEILEAFIEESSLSKLIGKFQGGQNLVRWLHKKHKLGNDAELVPAPFSERIFWKQFKSNPDDFVIVSAQNGVAGIKPSEEYVKHMQEKFAKKGKTYNPSGDANLQYQAIAFTEDGKQIDPSLLQAQPKGDEKEKDDKFISRDPTVIKARMGLHTGKDMQNPDNIFNLLAEQIGALRMVYVSGFDNAKDAEPGKGSVERDKMKARADMKAPAVADEKDSMGKIFKRVRPVLKKLGDQAYSQVVRMAQRYTNGGNFEAAQKAMENGKRLKDFMVQLDSPNDISLNAGYGSPTMMFTRAIIKSLEQASGSKSGSDEYKQWLDAAAKGNATALQPVLDGLREVLATMGSLQAY